MSVACGGLLHLTALGSWTDMYTLFLQPTEHVLLP